MPRVEKTADMSVFDSYNKLDFGGILHIASRRFTLMRLDSSPSTL